MCSAFDHAVSNSPNLQRHKGTNKSVPKPWVSIHLDRKIAWNIYICFDCLILSATTKTKSHKARSHVFWTFNLINPLLYKLKEFLMAWNCYLSNRLQNIQSINKIQHCSVPSCFWPMHVIIMGNTWDAETLFSKWGTKNVQSQIIFKLSSTEFYGSICFFGYFLYLSRLDQSNWSLSACNDQKVLYDMKPMYMNQVVWFKWKLRKWLVGLNRKKFQARDHCDNVQNKGYVQIHKRWKKLLIV